MTARHIPADPRAPSLPSGTNFSPIKRDIMGDEYVVHIPSGVHYYIRPKRKGPKRAKPVQFDLLTNAPSKPTARARVIRLVGQRNDNGGQIA